MSDGNHHGSLGRRGLPLLHDRVVGLVLMRGRISGCALTGEPDQDGVAREWTFPDTQDGQAALLSWIQADPPEIIAVESLRSPVANAGRSREPFIDEALCKALRNVFLMRGERIASTDPVQSRVSEVFLVDTHYFKRVPARPADVSDARWLAWLVGHGLYRTLEKSMAR